MKGQTKRHANAHLDEFTRREGGRGHQLEQPLAQARGSKPAARHVPWHVIAKRRARNRMAARSRRRNRR